MGIVPAVFAEDDVSMSPDPNRELAEWVLAEGGQLGLITGENKRLDVRKAARLPDAPFEIDRLDFGGQGRLTDAELAKIGELPELVELNLSYTRITDAGLDSLAWFPKLRRLYLAETEITDGALETIAEQNELASLDLSGTKISNENLGELKKLKNLSRLFLGRTQITGAGLKPLSEISGLTVLHLAGVPMKAEDLARLSRLSKLRELAVTTDDEGLSKLADLSALKTLTVYGPQVTDEGMPALAKCRHLEQLRLSRTSISERGLNRLDAELENCKVTAHPVSRQSAFLMSTGSEQRPVLRWQPGDPKEAWIGLIPRPAKLPGTARWQMESLEPRSEIRSVDFNPNGESIACATAAGHVRIYDAGNLVLKTWIPAHPRGVHAVAWSPDGTRLASAGADGLVRIWDAQGNEKHVFRGHGGSSVISLAWSPEGQWLASGSWSGVFRLWKADGSESRELPRHEKPITALVFRPDGKQIASGSRDSHIRIWDLQGQPIHEMKGHTEAVVSLAWSPRGSRLASGSWDKTIRFWNPRTGRGGPVLEGHTYRVFDLEWHPEGTHLASAGDRTLRLWTLDGTPVRTVKTEEDHIFSLSWKHDGNEIATGTRQNSVLRVVNLNDNTDRAVGEMTKGGVIELAWHPSGDRVAAGCWDRKIRLVTEDGRLGTVLEGHNYCVRALDWSPDGNRLASGGDSVLKIWNRQGIPLESAKKHEGGILCLDWSPDGAALVTVSQDGTARVWNPDAQEQSRAKLEGQPRKVAWGPESQKFVAASKSQLQIFHRDGTPGPVLSEPLPNLVALDWNRSANQIAAGGWSHTYRLWDSEGEAVAAVEQNQSLLDLAFHPDGSQVAIALFNNKLAIAGADGTKTRIWEAHAGPVNAVAWHPSGGTLVSGAYDNTLRFWDPNTAEPRAGVLFFDDGSGVTFTAAGQLEHGDVRALEDDLVYLVETPAGGRKMLSPTEFEEHLIQSTSLKEKTNQ